MHLAYRFAGVIRQQRHVNRVRRHQFGNKSFHSRTGQPVGIGKRNVEKVMAQRVPEGGIALLIATPAQFSKQMR